MVVLAAQNNPLLHYRIEVIGVQEPFATLVHRFSKCQHIKTILGPERSLSYWWDISETIISLLLAGGNREPWPALQRLQGPSNSVLDEWLSLCECFHRQHTAACKIPWTLAQINLTECITSPGNGPHPNFLLVCGWALVSRIVYCFREIKSTLGKVRDPQPPYPTLLT